MNKMGFPHTLDNMVYSADALSFGQEESDIRLQVPAIRVKANRWLTPSRFAKDGKTPIFPIKQVISFFGNGELKPVVREHPQTELAVPMDETVQNMYYKSTIGMLAVGAEVLPVRLETLNFDGEIPLALTVQHALIDTRDKHGVAQIRFR